METRDGLKFKTPQFQRSYMIPQQQHLPATLHSSNEPFNFVSKSSHLNMQPPPSVRQPDKEQSEKLP